MVPSHHNTGDRRISEIFFSIRRKIADPQTTHLWYVLVKKSVRFRRGEIVIVDCFCYSCITYFYGEKVFSSRVIEVCGVSYNISFCQHHNPDILWLEFGSKFNYSFIIYRRSLCQYNAVLRRTWDFFLSLFLTAIVALLLRVWTLFENRADNRVYKHTGQ